MPPTRSLSYWEHEHWYAPVDVAIVGGGIVGLQAALYLTDQRPDLRVAIVERDDPPAGASTRNAGFACVGSLGELADDIAAIGFAATIALVRRRARGLALLRERVGDEALRYRAGGNVEWFRPGEEADFARALELLPAVNASLPELGSPFVHDLGFRQNTGLAAAGAIVNRAEGELDAGAMVRALQRQLAGRGVLTLRTSVSAIGGDDTVGFELPTDQGRVLRARACVLAVNGFAERLSDAPVAPARNQVIVTAPVPGLRWTLPMHLERGYGYARRIGDRVLVGGFRNHFPAPAEASRFDLDEAIGEHLRTVLRELLPDGTPAPAVDYEWAGILGIGPTRSPEITVDERGLVRAVGLGGMGVALGSLLGLEAAERVLGGVMKESV